MAEGGGSESAPHFNEPEARYSACAAAIGKEVFMYRGYFESFKGKLRVAAPSRCEVFDTTEFQWNKRYTDGPNPKAWQSSSIAVFQHRLFFYGGWSGRGYTNELFELNALTSPMKWKEHKPKNPKKGPRKKEGSGFIALPGGEELCLFAGYGVPVGRDPPGTTTLKDKYRDGRGWTNELHCYHLEQATWRCPDQTGQRPPPGVAVTFTRVDARRVVVFAGYDRSAQRRVYDIHILDISIWHWSGVILPQGNQPWPEGRCYHTAYSLWDPDSNPQNPSLVVTSGWSEDAQPLGDLWVLEVNKCSWEELDLPDSLVPRLNHAGGLVHVSSTKRLLVTNGGIPEDTNLFESVKHYPIISQTVVTELEYDEAAAATGSCGWSVVSVTKDGSKTTGACSKPPVSEEDIMHKELERALRMGHVLANITTCLASGAPGAGKTHLRHFIFNLIPPELRISTACIEPAQRAILHSSEGGATTCKPVDSKELKSMVAAEVKVRSQPKQIQPGRPPVVPEVPPQQEAKPGIEMERDNASDGHSDTEEFIELGLPSRTQSSSRLPLPKDELHEELPETAEVRELMRSSISESKQLKEVHWVHFIDSGGQGEFLDVFPAYARNIQLLIAVFKLSEKLSEIPDTEYFDHEHKTYEQLGQFTQTNLELLLQIAQFSCYHMIDQSLGVASEHPRLMVVGTFADQENKKESIDAKNAMIDDNLKSLLDVYPGVVRRSSTEIIFPVDNTKAGTEAAEPVASELRRAILEDAPKLQVKLPTKWYLLELEIRKQLKKKVALGMQKCWEIAQKLQFESEESLRAALGYLNKADFFFYYPEIFDGVIDPEPVIGHLTSLYEKHASLHEKTEADISSDSDLLFRSKAIFTADIIVSSHDQDLLPKEKLMLLFENRLTVAKLPQAFPSPGRAKYFMPSLLRLQEIDDAFPPEAIYVAFPSNFVPLGLFCALVVQLLASHTNGSRWLLNLPKSDVEFKPLHKNFLELLVTGIPDGTITLINTLKYFMVLPSPEFPHAHLPQVREKIAHALEEACAKLSYRVLHVFAFPCDCSRSPDSPRHLATVNPEETLTCTKSPHKRGRMSKKQIVWYKITRIANTVQGIPALVAPPLWPSHLNHSSDYPGVLFAGDPLLEVADSTGRLLSRPDLGITLTIPSEAVPVGSKMHTAIWPALSGPFEPPEGYTLASPVYFISHNSPFQEDVHLSLAHFASLVDKNECSKMAFLALSSGADLVGKYSFAELKHESQFVANSAYGTIRLKYFRAIAVGKKVLKPFEKTEASPTTGTPPEDPPHCGNVYSVQLYENVGEDGGTVVFAVTLLHPVYIQNLKKELEQQFPRTHFWRTLKQPMVLQGNEVQLEIPELEGWDIESDKMLSVISKEEADLPVLDPEELSRGDYPPKIVLTVKPRKTSSSRVESSCVLKVFGFSEDLQFTVSLPEVHSPPVVLPKISTNVLDRSHPAPKESTPIVTRDPKYPRIRFLGTPWKEVVTSEGLDISWEDIGIAFSIPPGAVPEDKEPLQLTVRPCLAGPFEPPDGYKFTSSVYVISPSFEFAKEITMTLFHSVCLESDEDCELMSFLTAPTSPQDDGVRPQYKFKPLRGGLFKKSEQCATVALKHFCKKAIGSKRPNPSEADSDVGSEPKRRKEPPSDLYDVWLYRNSQPSGPCSFAIFCITRHDRIQIQHLKRCMREEYELTTRPSKFPCVQFHENSSGAKLELPETTGIIPDRDPPTISKINVDECYIQEEEDTYEPEMIHLNIREVGMPTPHEFSTLKVKILGLKDVRSFTLIPKTVITTPVSGHSSSFPGFSFSPPPLEARWPQITSPTSLGHSSSFPSFSFSPPPLEARWPQITSPPTSLGIGASSLGASQNGARVSAPPQPVTPPVQGRELGGGDLRTLASELEEVAGSWENLGLDLGMNPGILDGIKGPNKSSKDCLKDMLQERIKQGGLTWILVIQALTNGLAINVPLANKLKVKYGTLTETPTVSPTSPGSSAPMAVVSARNGQNNEDTNGTLLPSGEETPTLNQLQTLRVGQRTLRIMKAVAAQWERLAIALRLEEDIAIIRRRCHDPEDAILNVFQEWLKKQPTWNILIDALYHAGFDSLSRVLQDNLGQ